MGRFVNIGPNWIEEVLQDDLKDKVNPESRRMWPVRGSSKSRVGGHSVECESWHSRYFIPRDQNNRIQEFCPRSSTTRLTPEGGGSRERFSFQVIHLSSSRGPSPEQETKWFTLSRGHARNPRLPGQTTTTQKRNSTSILFQKNAKNILYLGCTTRDGFVHRGNVTGMFRPSRSLGIMYPK